MTSIQIRYTTIASALLAVLFCFTGCEKDPSLLEPFQEPVQEPVSFILAGSSSGANYQHYDELFFGEDSLDINNDGETDFIFNSHLIPIYGGSFTGSEIRMISTGPNCQILLDTSMKVLDTVRHQYSIYTYGSNPLQITSPEKLDQLNIINAEGYWDTTSVMKNLYFHSTSFLFDTTAGSPINGTIQRTYHGWGQQDQYLGFRIFTSGSDTIIGWLHLDESDGAGGTKLIDAAYAPYSSY